MSRSHRSWPLPQTVPATLAAVLLLLTTAAGADAQGLKLAVNDVGLGIGPVPEITGIRINFRDDDRFRRVTGINATIWSPRDDVRSDVKGLALGLPLTGAGNLTGIGLGAGVGVTRDFNGVALALLGMGAGRDMNGIMIGGLGVGAGGSGTGLLVGGLGAGVGGDFSGVAIGGLGIGAGGELSGITAALGGIGAGGDVTGLSIAGIGIGSGGHLKWVSVAGVGVGAPRITGLAAALGVGGMDVQGLIVAPAYFRIEDDDGRNPGAMRGVTLSAYSDVRGSMSGVQIGLINIADELHGLQIGLINIARNKETLSVLPLLNYHP